MKCHTADPRQRAETTTISRIDAPRSHHAAGIWCPKMGAASFFDIGSVIPIVIVVPREMAVEGDGAAVADRLGTNAHDRAANDAPAEFGAAILAFQLKLHVCARQQPVLGFHEDAAGRDVDDRRQVARPDARPYDSMLVNVVAPASGPAIRCEMGHSDIHCPVRASNRRIRVLPVWPKTRITSCTPRRLRRYRLPDDDVPSAVKVTPSLDPKRIGSWLGAAPPSSTGGRFGIVPKSTPVNVSPSRSTAPSRRSMPRSISAIRMPL